MSDFDAICIIALTRESLSSQWIMFEAGAISRSVENSRVCPILFEIKTTDLQGPLQRFQATKFSKAEIFQLLGTINANAGEQALSSSVLEEVCEMWWPKLESNVTRILAAAASSGAAPEVRTDRSLLEETLAIVRQISQEQIESRQQSRPMLLFLKPRRLQRPHLPSERRRHFPARPPCRTFPSPCRYISWDATIRLPQ
jgi:hypothetical protein